MITEAVVNLMFLTADEQSGRSNRGVSEAARSLLPAKSCWSIGPKPTESPCLMILRNVDSLSLCPGSVWRSHPDFLSRLPELSSFIGAVFIQWLLSARLPTQLVTN